MLLSDLLLPQGVIIAVLTLVGLALYFQQLSNTVYNTFWNVLCIGYLAFFLKEVTLQGSSEYFVYLSVSILFLYFIMKPKGTHFEYQLLILLSLLAANILFIADSMNSVLIALELLSLIGFTLIGMESLSNYSRGAYTSLRYLIVTAVPTGLIMLGLAEMFGVLGTLNFSELAYLTFILDNPVALACTLISAGLLFKLTAAPFHTWALSIYEGAPIRVGIYATIFPKLAIFGLFIRLLTLGYDSTVLLLIVGILSIIAAISGALSETRLKRFLVFSSVGHVGFMLLALSSSAVTSAIFYLSLYLVTSMAVWVIVSLYKKHHGEIISLAGLGTQSPMLSYVLSIFMLSMAGIPPLAGFFTKLEVLNAVIEQGRMLFVMPILMLTVISFYYYLRVIKVMYFEKGYNISLQVKSPAVLFVIMLFMVNVIFVGYQEPVVYLVENLAW